MQFHPFVNELNQAKAFTIAFEGLLTDDSHFAFLYLVNYRVSDCCMKESERHKMNGKKHEK
jgi:hypothetical protein